MTIQFITEMEQAGAALASRPSAELADFILSLAFASDGISESVHAFVLATEPNAAPGKVELVELFMYTSGISVRLQPL